MIFSCSRKAIIGDLIASAIYFLGVFVLTGMLGYWIAKGFIYLYLYAPWWVGLGLGYLLLLATLVSLMVFVGCVSTGIEYLEKALRRINMRYHFKA